MSDQEFEQDLNGAVKATKRVLSRADFKILEETGADLPTKLVAVPEWAKALGAAEGEEVFVLIRTLTGAERDNYESSLTTQRGKDRVVNLQNARAKLVALCMIDENTGDRLFSDREIGVLGKRSAAALDRLFDACRELSGLSSKAVEELTEEMKESPN